MTKELVTQARHDPAHVLAPGLFKSIKRGDRKGKNLDITYQHGDISLRFAGAWQLGSEDLRVLQGVAAMATASKAVIDLDTPQNERSKQLVMLLEPRNQNAKENAAAIKTSLQRLMREIGYKADGGKNRAQVIESLRRLANVTTYVKAGQKETSSHLLSYFVDEESGHLVIACNPRLTKAIIGDQFTLIDMREVRALSSGPARLLHQRLSGVVDPAKSRPLKLDTLLSYIWPDPVPSTSSAIRERRKTLRDVMKELTDTGGWAFTPKGDDQFVVFRQKAGYHVVDTNGATAP
jgi:hypothetical protein